MKNTSVPEPDTVLSELSSAFPIIYEGVEAAIQQTRDFFPEGKPVDTALAPNLVRYYVKEHLDQKSSVDSQLSISSKFERQPLPNNGLYLHFGSYQIRILKSDEGQLPFPGPSRARRRFYQQTLPDWARIAGEDQPNPVNLVILWDVNSEYGLKDLSIACPKDVGDSRGSVEVHWRTGIPHPASIGANSTYGFAEGADTVDVDEFADGEDVDDLDMTTRERPSTGTEHNGD